jgi:hypothetical protein
VRKLEKFTGSDLRQTVNTSNTVANLQYCSHIINFRFRLETRKLLAKYG